MTSQPPEPGQPEEWRAFRYPDYPPTPDYPPAPDYPATPGYPPTPDYPATPRNRRAPGYPDAPGHRRAAGLPTAGSARDGYAPAGHPPGGDTGGSRPARIPGALVTHEEYVHPGGPPAAGADVLRSAAGRAPGETAETARATGSEGTRWAMLAYLTVPFFGFLMPLAVYLTSLRGSSWVRAHAAQAINVWLTGVLYDLSAAIIGSMLVLDSPRVALTVVLPMVAALWLATLVFLMHAATAASRGETYIFPRWLCAPMVR
jgi:uncharacterized Tic20 family protein